MFQGTRKRIYALPITLLLHHHLSRKLPNIDLHTLFHLFTCVAQEYIHHTPIDPPPPTFYRGEFENTCMKKREIPSNLNLKNKK